MSRKHPELFGTVLDDWIRARRPWWRPSTYQSVLAGLGNFAPLCRLTVEQIDKIAVEHWLGQLPVARGTRRLLRSRLATAFNWAIDAGRADRNPATRVRLPAPDTERRALTAGEAAEWLRAARARSRHLELLGVFGLYTGLRLSNLLQLDTTRIRRDKIAFPGEMMKAGRRFEMPLHPVLVPFLGRLPFRVSGRHLQKVMAATEPRLHPHDLRHTFGTWLYAAAGDLRIVAEMLGHRRTRTTERYTLGYVPDYMRVVSQRFQALLDPAAPAADKPRLTLVQPAPARRQRTA